MARQRVLTRRQIADMADAYRAGAGTVDLARQFGVSVFTAWRWLKKTGVELRPRGSGKRRQCRRPALSPGELAELADAYRAGASARDLAKRFGVSAMTVLKWLRRSGVARRLPGSAQRQALSPGQLAELADAYRAGWGVRDLAKRFGVSATTVSTWLRRSGVEMRASGLDSWGLAPAVSPDRIAELADAYRAGAGVQDLAKRFGVCRKTVSRWLRRSGVEMRPNGRSRVQARALRTAAAARGITVDELRRRLLAVLNDEPSLIDAVLDDGIVTAAVTK